MCHAIPAAGAVITTILFKRTKDKKIGRLNLMFWGGALFGIIDHIWNGEFFVVPENLASDLFLGCVISFAILGFWTIFVCRSSISYAQNKRNFTKN